MFQVLLVNEHCPSCSEIVMWLPRMLTLNVRSPYVQVTTSHGHPTVTLPCMVTLPRMVTVPLIGLIISGEDEDDYDDDVLITRVLSECACTSS